MPGFPAGVACDKWLALMRSLVLVVRLLPRGVDVHIDDLIIHSSRGVGGVVAGSGAEVEAIKEITFEVGGAGKEGLLSTAGSHVAVYFTGHIDPVLYRVFRRSFSVVDFVQDLGI